MGTDMKTSAVIEQVAAQIEAALNGQPYAAANASIPRRVRFLAAQLSGRDHYAAEKAYRIAELAQQFYSARKHAKYPGGAEALWAEMTHDLLGRIRSQARSREAGGD
jgi:hypothetical protein